MLSLKNLASFQSLRNLLDVNTMAGYLKQDPALCLSLHKYKVITAEAPYTNLMKFINNQD